MDIFPPVAEHVHAPTIAELPNGDLLVAWFQGSGERTAEDVGIWGSRLQNDRQEWSQPFLLADTSDFPDINPVLFVGPKGRLWLVWYTVIAHQWDTSLLKYRLSSNFDGEGAPEWDWQDVIHVKPGSPASNGIQPDDRFVRSIERQLDSYQSYLAGELRATELQVERFREWGAEILGLARGVNMLRKGRLLDSGEERDIGYPYFRRMGWQTKNKPLILENGRIILPLYSDGFDFSLMAITDDEGRNWQFSEPLVGTGNIQPSILQASDGSLAAYMRDNGPPPKRLQVSRSWDLGMTWSPVRDSILPNPGSGSDALRLAGGAWAIVNNDTERGRHRLAVSLSYDDGKSWPYSRHLELDERPGDTASRSHYPAVIQGHDGSLRIVYSYHAKEPGGGDRKTIRYARVTEEWVRQGDGKSRQSSGKAGK